MQRGFNMIIDRGCLERGCACYDERDRDGIEVVKREWVGLTDEEFDYYTHWVGPGILNEIEKLLEEKNT